MNELSKAVSYCILYKTAFPYRIDSPTAAVIGKEETSFQPWVADEWTTAEKKDAEAILQENKEQCAVSSEQAILYEQNASRHWDSFYSVNRNKFFKDRHYLNKVFPELNRVMLPMPNIDVVQSPFVVAEVGCGVGNAILPLIETAAASRGQPFHFVATDFSPVAIELLQNDDRYRNATKMNHGLSVESTVWDITRDDSPPPSCIQGVADVTLVLFCLSATNPERMKQAAQNISKTLKGGGTLLFRDYGRYDAAQMKLGNSRKKQVGENFYVKHDGTRCYYFEEDDVKKLFGDAGLETIELGYVLRKYINRRETSVRRRVWVQARFRKPLEIEKP